MLFIEPIRAFRDNYIWLLRDSHSNRACVVDPGDAAPVIEALRNRNLALETILITHHHPDHVGGVARLVEQYAPRVYGPRSDHFTDVDVVLADNDRLAVLDHDFEVLTVPGHTLDHIAYYHHTPGQPPALFPGDTLFAGGCGRLFEGTAEQMHHSLSKLASLPGNTRVYCAHEYTLTNLRFALAVEPGNTALQQRLAEVERLRSEDLPTLPSTIALEKATNPFLRTAEPEVVAAASQYSGHDHSRAPASETFATIRSWKDNA